MYSLLKSPNSSEKPSPRDRDWIVVDQTKQLGSPSEGMAPQSPTLSHASDEGVLLPVQPRLDSLLDSIACQRKELAAMKKAFLEGQAQIQEERDLFQAQSYALRNQQEEREAKKVDDKQAEWKADLEHLRAELGVRQTANSEAVQKGLGRMEDQLGKEKKSRVDEREQLQDIIAGLRGAQEAQAAELVDLLEQVQARLSEVVEQVAELGNAVAALRLMQDEQKQLSNTERHDLQTQIDEVKDTSTQTHAQLNIEQTAAEQQRQSRRSSGQQTISAGSPPQRGARYSRAEHRSNHADGFSHYDFGIMIAGMSGLVAAAVWWLWRDE